MYSARDKELCLSVLDKGISVTTRINKKIHSHYVSIIIFVLGMTPFLFILIIAVIDIIITLIGNPIFLRPLMHDEEAIVVRMDCYLHNTRV